MLCFVASNNTVSVTIVKVSSIARDEHTLSEHDVRRALMRVNTRNAGLDEY